MEESGFRVKHGRGGVISFLAPGQDKPTRLRASTLGDGFDPEDTRAVIAGERPIPELPQETPAPARRVNLIIDIQQRMAQMCIRDSIGTFPKPPRNAPDEIVNYDRRIPWRAAHFWHGGI